MQTTALFRYLNQLETQYAGKVEEVRAVLAGWLEYIPATFPYYTRHTIGHSDEIVRQLSHLLFNDDDPEQAVLPLSSSEAFILITSALLHDAGMVMSDTDKASLLGSSAWEEWLSTSPSRQEQLENIDSFRSGDSLASPELRNFLADVRLRQVLAEFVRRTHHERVTPLLVERENEMGRFAFGDPVLLQTIGSVCAGHGLARTDLDDHNRYPDRRDVHGAAVNVRLMTILLRLGDLLDMSVDRACPLLQSAAAPLPRDSLAHWDQYQRIRHRVTSPDMIELDAECETADEHRLLRDWCQWIVDEVNGSRALMAGARRHAGWTPPVARIGGPDATMLIRVAPGAGYVPADWTFELDAAAVVDRFVSDVAPGRLNFVKELVQNALDATRCRLSDLYYGQKGKLLVDIRAAPPTQRVEHAVKVTLSTRVRPADSSSDNEKIQELTIDDAGVGMAQSDIQRYFLQIGQSFYTTPAFKAAYSFAPTSRFGVGFLSVFRDSDHVVVETATADDIAQGNGGLRLTLVGPRNYILTERGRRTTVGTRITAVLRHWVEAGALTSLLRSICLRVEVPVIVDDMGESTEIEHEQPDAFVWERAIPNTDGEAVAVKAFQIAGDGVDGELYLTSRRLSDGSESWADRSWIEHGYSTAHPGSPLPSLPESVICINGLLLGRGSSLTMRLDYRRPTPNLGMARGGAGPVQGEVLRDPKLRSSIGQVLSDHLAETACAQGSDAWSYLGRMARDYPVPQYWDDVVGVVPAVRNGAEAGLTLREVDQAPVFTTLQSVADYFTADQSENREARAINWADVGLPTGRIALVDWQINRFTDPVLHAVFDRRAIAGFRAVSGQWLAYDWVVKPGEDADNPSELRVGGEDFLLVDADDDQLIGFVAHHVERTGWGMPILNRQSPLIRWVIAMVEAARTPHSGISPRQLEPLGTLLETPCVIQGYEFEKLSAYLEAWCRDDVATTLRPPIASLRVAQFTPPGASE